MLLVTGIAHLRHSSFVQFLLIFNDIIGEPPQEQFIRNRARNLWHSLWPVVFEFILPPKAPYAVYSLSSRLNLGVTPEPEKAVNCIDPVLELLIVAIPVGGADNGVAPRSSTIVIAPEVFSEIFQVVSDLRSVWLAGLKLRFFQKCSTIADNM